MVICRLTHAVPVRRYEVSRCIVSAFRLDADKLVSFYDVRGKRMAINASGIEADRLGATPRFLRGPMSEDDDLFTVVNMIPGCAFVTFTIRSQSTQARQITGGL